MFTWKQYEDHSNKQFLVFEDNPNGIGFGVLQKLERKKDGETFYYYRWAPLLRDLYDVKSSSDFPEFKKATSTTDEREESLAKRIAINETITMLTKFGLRSNGSLK